MFFQKQTGLGKAVTKKLNTFYLDNFTRGLFTFIGTCVKTRGRFHKSWVHGANHRDSSIHLRPTPTPPPKLEKLFTGAKQFMKLTPGRLAAIFAEGQHTN